MLRKMVFAASLFALAVPAGGVMAQGYYGYDGYNGRHAQDHQEHGAIHDEVDETHARAHDEGFYSRREHSAYHRALSGIHEDFHDEHPGTRHDGYRLPSRRGGGYGYQNYGGYSSYGAPYGYSNRPRVTYSYDRGW